MYKGQYFYSFATKAFAVQQTMHFCKISRWEHTPFHCDDATLSDDYPLFVSLPSLYVILLGMNNRRLFPKERV